MTDEQKQILEYLMDYIKINFDGDVLEEWGSGEEGRAEGMTLEAILAMIKRFRDRTGG